MLLYRNYYNIMHRIYIIDGVLKIGNHNIKTREIRSPFWIVKRSVLRALECRVSHACHVSTWLCFHFTNLKLAYNFFSPDSGHIFAHQCSLIILYSVNDAFSPPEMLAESSKPFWVVDGPVVWVIGLIRGPLTPPPLSGLICLIDNSPRALSKNRAYHYIKKYFEEC